MDRRGFLKSILASGVAPAVVGSGILMPIRSIILPGDMDVAFALGKEEEVQWLTRERNFFDTVVRADGQVLSAGAVWKATANFQIIFDQNLPFKE